MSKKEFENWKGDLDDRAEEFVKNEENKVAERLSVESDNIFIGQIEKEGYKFAERLPLGTEFNKDDYPGDVRIEKRRNWLFLFRSLKKLKP